MTNTMPAQVFLCHASEDMLAVRKLFNRLTKDGIDAWLEEEKLLPGQNRELEIFKAVKNSAAIIVCLSAKSVVKAGLIQKEIKLALDAAGERPEGTICVIPARLDKCVVPDSLVKYQSVDLFGDKDKGYGKIKQALKTIIDLPEKGTTIASVKNAIINLETDLQQLKEYNDLLEEYNKLAGQLSVEMERLVEKENEKEALKVLYIQHFSKYLLEQKDLQIECDTVLNTIQKLQYISEYNVHYVELLETTREVSESQLLIKKTADNLHHKSCDYEFKWLDKELYISALLSDKFCVSKYSFPDSVLNLIILNGITLNLKTEKTNYVFEIKVRQFQLEEIKNILGFSEPRNKYEDEKSEINNYVSLKVDEPSLGKEEIDDMKRMYKEIMLHAHPDIFGGEYPKDWSPEKVEKYKQTVRDAITAYKNFDIEALRQVYETIKGEDVLKKELEARQDNDRISYLQKKIEWYKTRIETIRSKIKDILNSDVYGYKNVLQSPEKLDETEQKLKDVNDQLSIKFNELKEELDQLFNSYKKQDGNE